MNTTLNRNAPCHCGSGKKYKKCHLLIDEKNNPGVPRPRAKFVKTPQEIDGMRKAGAFNGELMDYMRQFVVAGVSTGELDKRAHDYTVAHGAIPACLHYKGFPKTVCTSINNVVCHGIPSATEILKDGDIVNLDLTSIVDGYYGDSSETFLIGNVSDAAKRLVTVTAQAMLRGIAACTPGNHLSAVARAIDPFAKENGCSVVHQYTGHGIGKNFHEHFSVYHHIARDCDDVTFEPGMTLTIEPMINLGDWPVVTDHVDKWTVRTKDGSLSAQYEHTILITQGAPEILTLTPSQKAGNFTIVIPGIFSA
jgi:methionyl aminopeptidase